MIISTDDWARYIKRLSSIDDRAGAFMRGFMRNNPAASADEIIAYAQSLTKYFGEAAAALACEMYDGIAAASGVVVPAAEPAAVFDDGYIANSVKKTIGKAPSLTSDEVARMVKQANADTMLKNAKRDGAEFAWIPHGDTCPFCIMLASNGWQHVSRDTLKGGHATHIHAHCDCEYTVRFNERGGVRGYDPQKYEDMYKSAAGDGWEEKINAMRREDYAANADEINAQKRAAYKARVEREKE